MKLSHRRLRKTMKKILTLFLLLALAILLIACGESGNATTAKASEDLLTSAESESAAVTESDTEAETTSAETDGETAHPVIPDSYYTNPEYAFNCSSIVIPAAYNEGIAYDLHPYVKDGVIYFLLPSRADLSKVVYHLLKSNGELLIGRVADFTKDDTLCKSVNLGGRVCPIVAYRSDSPTLYIEIDDAYGTIEEVQADRSKETRAYGTLLLECRDDIAEKYGYKTSYLSTENDADSPCTMYVKGRGNWTWLSNDKKGYSIKLEKKLDLLGMSKSKKWALICNTPDNAMLRNPLASFLSRAADMPYTPSGEIVDLYVNGEYYGAFLLSEKVTIDDDRVDIADLEEAIEALDPEENYGKQRQYYDKDLGCMMLYWTDVPDPEDITGGYLLEMEMSDRFYKEASGFTTPEGFYYVIKSPEYASLEQVKYIAALVIEAEEALFSKDGINPTTGKAYSDYFDLETLAKKYWIDEIAKNVDGAKTSHYLYKPADSQSTKIFTGPVWDYDIAFSDYSNPQDWFSRTEKKFYKACFKHKDFAALANEIFLDIYYPAVKTFILEEADRFVEKNYASMTMNYIVWDQLDMPYLDYVEQQKTYLEKRIDWIYRTLTE